MIKVDLKSLIGGVIIGTVGVTTVFASGGIRSASLNTNGIIFNGKTLDLSGSELISVVWDGGGEAVDYMPVWEVFEQIGYDVLWNGEANSFIVAEKTGTNQVKTPAATVPKEPSQSANVQKMLELINKERAKAGVSALAYAQDIADIAGQKAKDMADNNYFAHLSPTYGSTFDITKSRGILYWRIGENLATGQTTPEAAMQAWMKSPEHKDNILNADYSEVGIGTGRDSRGKLYWVQLFIKRR